MVELIIRFGGTKRAARPRRLRSFVLPIYKWEFSLSLWPKASRLARPKSKQLKLPLGKRELVFSFLAVRRRSPAWRTRALRLPLFSKQLVFSLFPVRARRRSRRQHVLVIPYSPRLALTALLLLLGVVGTAYFGMAFARANNPPPAPSDQVYAPPVPLENLFRVGLPEAQPKAIRIPAIELANSSLIELGRKDDGTMEVPKGYDEVGWYKYAPTPGEVGPAILVGHVDSYRGAAVFYRLGQLKPGDIIEVDRVDGTTAKFKVDSVKQFPQNNFPTAEVYGNIDYPGLRLITCGGNFSYSTLEYDHNTIVFASYIN